MSAALRMARLALMFQFFDRVMSSPLRAFRIQWFWFRSRPCVPGWLHRSVGFSLGWKHGYSDKRRRFVRSMFFPHKEALGVTDESGGGFGCDDFGVQRSSIRPCPKLVDFLITHVGVGRPNKSDAGDGKYPRHLCAMRSLNTCFAWPKTTRNPQKSSKM